MDWEQAYEQEPWGEFRDDMRNVASVMHLLHQPGQLSLMYPYLTSENLDREVQQLQKLQKRAQTPEHKAKLRAARDKHRAMIAEEKARGR